MSQLQKLFRCIRTIKIGKDSNVIVSFAIDAAKEESVSRFAPENSKDAIIPVDKSSLSINKEGLPDSRGRIDMWLVKGNMHAWAKNGKKYIMTWEVMVVARNGKLIAELVGFRPEYEKK